MRDFLRRHLFIVLGVSLPLALIALVLAVQGVQRWGVESPATPVLYVYQAEYYQWQHVDLEVVDGSLTAGYRRPDNENIAR
ncbi:MAG TPA: hypothetical protein VLA56_08205, partial [Pseudomonadales bacterium]|nr:hypothetical protein [Pseudomonadales bacterium]